MEIGDHLNIEKFMDVARYKEKVSLSKKARERLEKSRETIEKILKSGDPVYGVNTGFGALASVRISKEELSDLQRNIILSHSAGFGKPLEEEIVRGMMLLRAVSLSKGYSGVRPLVVEKLIEFLNTGVYPYVPEKGSVGASGDLAPLAHLTLPLLGEGYVIYKGEKRKSREVLKELEIEPIKLREKEGLALINGTQAMTSILTFSARDAERLLYLATMVAAISFEALNGIYDPFEEGIHELRPHKGQKKVAELFRELTKDEEKRRPGEKVQDAYSLRTIPQVYGAVLDTIKYAQSVLETEMNSVTDNPLIFDDGRALSGGNFHGEPVALIADFLAIALADLGNMIERRIDRLLNPKVNEGLPPFLASGKEGLNSGYMIFQYTAAALCNENKVLSYPASADTIPTSAYQEDHVSMGMTAALKLKKILENVIHILSIEAMLASVAIEHRKRKLNGLLGEFQKKVYSFVQNRHEDGFFWEDLERVRNYIINLIRGKEKFWRN
ncbi:MAG: histidine ammonia-lyase [Thermotogaceae bacterium]|nr:histidine ammonia-lyase [Thermotogaceae bacterium]